MKPGQHQQIVYSVIRGTDSPASVAAAKISLQHTLMMAMKTGGPSGGSTRLPGGTSINASLVSQHGLPVSRP